MQGREDRARELAEVVRAARAVLAGHQGGGSERICDPRWVLADGEVWWLTEPVAGCEPIGDLYLIRADEHLFAANTAVTWRDQRWAMVDCSLSPPSTRLLIHEAFHAFWQPSAWDWVQPRDGGDQSLNESEGRALLLAELRGWERALRNRDERSAALATVVRAERLRRCSEEEASRQDYLELWEGMAEYSAFCWSGAPVDEVADLAQRGPEGESWFRSFCYTTGPVLGYVLDTFGPAAEPWMPRIRQAGSLTTLIGETIRASASVPEALAELKYREMLQAQEQIVRGQLEVEAERRRAFAPTLWVPLRGAIRFNPQEVRQWDIGTYYQSLHCRSEDFELDANDGAIVTTDWAWVGLACPQKPADGEASLTGAGWQVKLHAPQVALQFRWSMDLPG